MIKAHQVVIFTLVFFLMPLMASYAHAQNENLVGSVEIEGNKRIETSTLLYYIKTRKGEPLSRTQISKDVEQIYGLGEFKDIRVETRQGSEGMEVVFIVEEIPSIGNVLFYGNKEIEDSEMLELLEFKRGEAFQQHMTTEGERTN